MHDPTIPNLIGFVGLVFCLEGWTGRTFPITGLCLLFIALMTGARFI